MLEQQNKQQASTLPQLIHTLHSYASTGMAAVTHTYPSISSWPICQRWNRQKAHHGEMAALACEGTGHSKQKEQL
jgi:hypothetical protein